MVIACALHTCVTCRCTYDDLLAPLLGSSARVRVNTAAADQFAFLDGTSTATSHVSGIAALVWGNNLAANATQVRLDPFSMVRDSHCDNTSVTYTESLKTFFLKDFGTIDMSVSCQCCNWRIRRALQSAGADLVPHHAMTIPTICHTICSCDITVMDIVVHDTNLATL